VEQLLLAALIAHLADLVVDVFLAVLLGPHAAACCVAYVDDLAVIGNLAGAHHTAVFVNDVTEPDNEVGRRGIDGEEERLLPPRPLLVDDVRVAAFFIGVVVVADDAVGAVLLVAVAARALAGTEREKLDAGNGGEAALLPHASAGLLAVVVRNALVAVELGAVLLKKPLGGIVGGAGENDAPELAGEHEVKHVHHGERGLAEATRPMAHLVPVAVHEERFDEAIAGPDVELRRLRFEVAGEVVLLPLLRVVFQPGNAARLLLEGLVGLNGGALQDGFPELVPIL